MKARVLIAIGARLVAMLAVATAFSARAQTISFNFSGTIQSVNDPNSVLPNDITVGLPFSGTLTYDTSLVQDFVQADPNNGVYRFEGAAANHFSMNVGFGSHTLTVNPSPSLPNYIQAFLGSSHVLDHGAREFLLDGANPPGNLVDWSANLRLDDSTATALPSDALPTSVPLLSDFTMTQFLFDASNGPDTFLVTGGVTSITPVPEPAAFGAIVAAALVGFAVLRASGPGSRWTLRSIGESSPTNN
jgi:hypothetical protein